MARYLKKNKKTANAKALERARKRIVWQAGLAGVTIVLTMVILFAMTSAWYTNIVQTSGLTFQAEAWGFDGEITVSEDVVKAAPGDEGNIHLEVANNSESVASVSVGVSKARIEEPEMRKRLFFYVDTQLTREGETMDRVYLNTMESYTYNLFGQDKLTLTEDMHSDAPIKWQWVYDMLGYYVLGSWSEADTFIEAEYLRPIEYDYDEATYAMVEDDNGAMTMVMKTVDGKTTMESFLKKLSRTDGYQGEIDTSKGKQGYYPVDVDETGYGVYAFLCSYSDIEMATRYDTKLGETAAKIEAGEEVEEPPKPCTVQLTISAQKNDENFIKVDTVAALQAAMTLEADTTLQMTDDLTITADTPLVIPDGKRIILDLNGHTLSSTASDKTITATPGSSLTIINGTMTAAEGTEADYAVYAAGAEVTFNQVKMTGFQFGVYVNDIEGDNTLDTRCRLVNCEIDSDSVAVFVSGNGSDSAQKTQVVIENCKLSGTNYALCGNGTVTNGGRWGTDIQILNSELTGDPNNLSAGIYHPQKDSTLTIYNSTVTGYTGIAFKAGELNILDSKIYGKGAYKAAAFDAGGFTDTGDAVYVETNYGYDIAVTVKGNSLLSSVNSYPLQVYKEDEPHVSVKVYSCSQSGGKGLIPEKYLAEGSSVEPNTKDIVASAEAE